MKGIFLSNLRQGAFEQSVFLDKANFFIFFNEMFVSIFLVKTEKSEA